MSARRRRKRERRYQPPAPPIAPRPGDALRETQDVARLAYSRRQAAEGLGVSLATIDRRVVPLIDTVKTPWGQRVIPVAELGSHPSVSSSP